MDVHLSVCVGSACDGDIGYGGGTIARYLGFPFELLDFNNLELATCPAEEASCMMIIIAAAAGSGALLLAVVISVTRYRKKTKKKPNAPLNEGGAASPPGHSGHGEVAKV